MLLAETAKSSIENAPMKSSSLRTQVGRVLVGFSIFGCTEFPPFVWFNSDHAGSTAWPIHAKFHLMWNACLLMTLGAFALAGLLAWWNREPKVRLMLSTLPILIALTYVLAGSVVAPAILGVPDAYAERTPITIFGYHTQFEGWYLLMGLAVGGYLLDRRARAVPAQS